MPTETPMTTDTRALAREISEALPENMTGWARRDTTARIMAVVERALSLTPTDTRGVDEAVLNDIAVMMSEFVDNWPNPKRIGTALALISKTIRTLLDPPRHQFWGAGEPDCPREIKAGNGELHTLRCKVCGEDDPRDDRCLSSLTPPPHDPEEGAPHVR